MLVTSRGSFFRQKKFNLGDLEDPPKFQPRQPQGPTKISNRGPWFLVGNGSFWPQCWPLMVSEILQRSLKVPRALCVLKLEPLQWIPFDSVSTLVWRTLTKSIPAASMPFLLSGTYTYWIRDRKHILIEPHSKNWQTKVVLFLGLNKDHSMSLMLNFFWPK